MFHSAKVTEKRRFEFIQLTTSKGTFKRYSLSLGFKNYVVPQSCLGNLVLGFRLPQMTIANKNFTNLSAGLCGQKKKLILYETFGISSFRRTHP